MNELINSVNKKCIRCIRLFHINNKDDVNEKKCNNKNDSKISLHSVLTSNDKIKLYKLYVNSTTRTHSNKTTDHVSQNDHRD